MLAPMKPARRGADSFSLGFGCHPATHSSLTIRRDQMAWKKAFVLGSAGVALLCNAAVASAQRTDAKAKTAKSASARAPAPQGMDAKTKRGQMLYQNRGCAGCHGIIGNAKGKYGAAPDLAGVTARRSNEWLHRWLKETDAMIASDETAMALVKQYNGAKMKIPKLSDNDIDAILAFMKTKGG